MCIFHCLTCATAGQTTESLPNQLFQIVRQVSYAIGEKNLKIVQKCQNLLAKFLACEQPKVASFITMPPKHA